MSVLFNPTVPVQCPIPCGSIRPGHSVVVLGEALNTAKRFSLKLIEQSTTRCIFDLDVQFDLNRIVCSCNHTREQVISSLPVQRCQFFYLEIKCTHDRFMVAVNGLFHCEFSHKVQPSTADTFEVRGDVQLWAMEFKTSESNSNLPPFWKHRFHVASPTLPYVSAINGQLMNGHEIQIFGRVKPQAKRFSVNLQQGNRISTDSLIVLHINPRFESRGRAVIVNSRGGRWGEEKRIEGSRNPLHCGANFLLTIRQQLNHFDIELNGSKAAEFKHRLLPDVADSLFIEGDAIVDRILVF